MGIALLIIIFIVGIIYLASKINEFSLKVENLKKETASQSDLKLFSYRLRELESELHRIKEAVGLAEPEKSQAAVEPALKAKETAIAERVVSEPSRTQSLTQPPAAPLPRGEPPRAPEPSLDEPVILSKPQPKATPPPMEHPAPQSQFEEPFFLREESSAVQHELEPHPAEAQPETAIVLPPLEPASPQLEPSPPIPKLKPVPPVFVAKPPKPSRTREEWEALIGGKWLNRIGALALIIGMGFFLKYAFDRNWITEWMRVIMGGLIGAGLLVWGRRFHKKGLEIFAQGLVGAGISILYLSVYASFNFYHLVPQIIAFGLMSGVTFLTFSQAFKYDSFAVALLGWAGGFLTPFLLSTGKANEVGLFSYIVLLDLGLLAVVLKKDVWAILEPLTFGATFLTYGLWYYKFYTPADFLPTVLFLAIFWGLFYALDVHRIFRPVSTSPGLRQVIAALNGACSYAGMYLVINPKHHEWMGWVTLIGGAIYFSTILLARKRHPRDALVVVRYVLTAIVLLVLATTIQFSGFTTVIYWALEALILIWCGARWRLGYVWKAALGLFGIATIHFVSTRGALSYDPIELFSPLLNQRTFSLFVLTAAIGVSSFFLRASSEGDFKNTKTFLDYGWCIFLFGLCTIEVNDYFRLWQAGVDPSVHLGLHFNRDLIFAGIWMIYSLPLAWFGLRRNLLPLLICGLGALVPSVLLAAFQGIAFEPIQNFSLVLNLRCLVLSALIAALMVHARWLDRKGEIDQIVRTLLHYVWCILLFVLCTVEVNDYFRLLQISPGVSIPHGLHFNRDLILAGIWVIYSLPLAWLGLRRNLRPLLICGLGALVPSVFLAVYRGIAFEPIQDFSLVLNLRCLVLSALIAALMVHARWLNRGDTSTEWKGPVVKSFQYAWALLLFFLCTVETFDHFRQIGIQTGWAREVMLSFSRDMILVMIWVLYSLPMAWIGLQRKTSPMVHCGLGAMAFAILLGSFRGIRFEPIQHFIPLLNLRAVTLISLMVGLWSHARLLRDREAFYNWTKEAVGIIRYVGCLLLLLYCTVETTDHFRWLETTASSMNIRYLRYMRDMMLPAIWAVYALPLVAYGIRRNATAMLYCGFGAFIVAVVGGGIRGIVFIPIEKFTLLFNVRAFTLIGLVLGTFFHTFWLKKRYAAFQWVEKALVGLQIGAVVLIFELITFEIWDFFGKGMLESTRASLLFARLSNLKHLSLSGAWLLYSIALLILGFWRRIQRLRIAAILLSGVTILKIFIYDLSFLETLYRIFSFIGLGLILLITSYFYHRFRSVIFGDET